MKKIKQAKGITIIALVITIIVLLILAGVTINLTVGQNGIITKAQQAKEKQDTEEEQKQLQMAILNLQGESVLNNTGNKTLSEIGIYLKDKKGLIESYEITGIGTSQKLEVTTKKGYKYIIDQNNKVSYVNSEGEVIPEEPEVIPVPDLTSENVTFTYTPSTWTNGTVQVGIATTVNGYTLQYSLNGTTWNTYTTSISVTTNQEIYARLWDGTKYGGVATGNILNIDKTLPELTISTTNTTNNIAIIATGTDGESGIQKYRYSKDNGATWEESTNTTYTFTGLTQGQEYEIKVEAVDNAGNTTAKTATVTTGVVTGLTGANTTFTYTPSTWTNGNVQVGIATTVNGYTLQYSLNGTTWNTYTTSITVTTNQAIYARLWDGTNYGGVATGNITIIDKAAPTISFTQDAGTTSRIITIDAIDTTSGINKIQYNNAGAWEDLTTTDITNGKRATKTVGLNGTYTFKTIDNAGNSTEQSVTVTGMTIAQVNAPVLETGMTPIKWNGTSWETTTSSDIDWYSYVAQSSDAGTSKWANAQTADGSMWVWIPRYAYKITSGYHTSTAGTIDVKFLNGTTDTAYDGTSCTRTTATNTNYTVHPCFTNNTDIGGWDTELTGIWVAKFEASGTSSTINIKPGVSSIRSILVDNVFTSCRNMETNSRYGWGTTGTGIDTHLMKNSEWGAAAYLAQSKYGRNGTELTVNTSSSYYTGGGTGTAYTTNLGQSTTKNVYGIYDMSGGAYEYTAAYLRNGTNILIDMPNLVTASKKYRQVYDNYAASILIYGDAMYETSSASSGSASWNSDWSYFTDTIDPVFSRSGGYNSGGLAGVFGFYYSYASQSSSNTRFSPSITCWRNVIFLPYNN